MTAPIILAHGFTQTARSWDTIAALLADRGRDAVTAIDMPGHGTAHDLRCDLWGSADHLLTQGGPGAYVGYSMGGRVCLHLALAHPGAVQRLVLIGATAGLDDNDRTRRRVADEAIADRLESVGVEAFIDEWLTNDLFAGLNDETAQRADRLRNTVDGLASSLRLTGTGTQSPLWNRLDEIAIPVLLLVGEHDAKFRAIAERMHTMLPDSKMEVIANAGHSVHLEQPESTVDAIMSWLPPH